MGKPWRKNSSMVLRQGRTYSKMRWAILWTGKQESGATVQSFKSLAWVIMKCQVGGPRIMLENCLKFAHKLSWNACIWHEWDDLTFCGRATSLHDQSQNRLRHVTDDWQDWFHTFITHTWLPTILSCGKKRHSTADCVYFKTQTLRETLWTQNLPVEESYVSSGSRTYVPISWMCKKQTPVSHSSTESEIISLDGGLRMDGLLALEVWVIMIEVLRSTNNNVQPKHTSTQDTGATPHSKTEAQKA